MRGRAPNANNTVLIATTSHASTSSTYSTTATSRSTVSELRAARAMVPVTQVPTGNVKLHQVRANGSRPPAARAVRSVIAAASTSHIIANPHTGTPYSRAATAAPVPYGAGSTGLAALARLLVAVTDCPSGPSTIHSVGAMAAAPTLCWTSRAQICGTMISVASRLMPNIA